MPVMESKTADVFAFGMLAVEVFTGKLPFGEQRSEAVVLRISQGGRPEMPEAAQAVAVGLTGEIWKLLESCWQQNPEERPTMEEIVRRWERFVENSNDDGNSFPECVQISLVIRISSSVRFSTPYDRPREPQPSIGSTQSTSRLRVMAYAPQPPTMPAPARLRTEAHQSRTSSNKPNRLETNSAVVRPGTKPEVVHQVPRSEVGQRGTKPEAVQSQARSPAPRPSESVFSEGYRSQVLMTTDAEEPVHSRKGMCGCIVM